MAKKRVNSVKRSFIDKYFTLDWKEVYLLIITWFLFLALHFLVNNIFKTNETVLFFIAKWVIPVFFFVALIYTIFMKSGKR